MMIKTFKMNRPYNKFVNLLIILLASTLASCASTGLSYRSVEGLTGRSPIDLPASGLPTAISLPLPNADEAVDTKLANDEAERLLNEALEQEQLALEQQAAERLKEEEQRLAAEERRRVEEERRSINNAELRRAQEARSAESNANRPTGRIDTNQGNQPQQGVIVPPQQRPVAPTPPPAARPATPPTQQVTPPSRAPLVQEEASPLPPSMGQPTNDGAILAPPPTINEPPVNSLKDIAIEAVKGKEFVIALEGERWFPQTSRIDPALNFQGKDFDQQGRSVFRFKVDKPGSYSLKFNRNGPNGLEVQTVNITIDEAPVQPNASVQPEEKPVVEPEPAPVMPINPSLPGTASDQQLINSTDEMNENEIRQLFDATIANSGRENVAAQMLDRFKTRFPRSNLLPKMLYDLAQAFEKPGPNRDIERSYGYYKLVFDNYPISPYSRMSKERIDYLNRFYFKIS